jgi:hypothetical protein
LQAILDGLGGAELPRLGEAHRKRVLAARTIILSGAGVTSIAVKDLMSEGFLSATPPNGPLLSRAMGDLQLRDHVFVPLICPTCQIILVVIASAANQSSYLPQQKVWIASLRSQ